MQTVHLREGRAHRRIQEMHRDRGKEAENPQEEFQKDRQGHREEDLRIQGHSLKGRHQEKGRLARHSPGEEEREILCLR